MDATYYSYYQRKEDVKSQAIQIEIIRIFDLGATKNEPARPIGCFLTAVNVLLNVNPGIAPFRTPPNLVAEFLVNPWPAGLHAYSWFAAFFAQSITIRLSVNPPYLGSLC